MRFRPYYENLAILASYSDFTLFNRLFQQRYQVLVFNIMARYSERLAKIVKETGIRGLISLVRQTMASPWLDRAWIEERLAAPYQLRLI